ncbi:MAG: class I SAM-dependent methyltransferase [Gammaproteobacteria bacterium]|nr:class I SAM-dependent methyltransferase [Gammaproteobacteria bacterium]
MKPYQTLKLQSLAIAALFIVITLIGAQFFSLFWVILITASAAIVALSWRMFRALHRQIEIQQFRVFRQSEALIGLYGTLDIKLPLPQTRHRAASPDFLHLMAREIFRIRPELIIEAGSGTSTLVAAYCLKKLGRGKIISLDHMDKYADISRQAIKSHGLDGFADVLYAPIKEYDIDGKTYPWYDDIDLKTIDQIDMLIVDGPPRNVAIDARYPAVPLLIDKLHKNSIVLLDDGARPGERNNVSKWKQKYSLHYSSEPTEKGAFSCHFSNS